MNLKTRLNPITACIFNQLYKWCNFSKNIVHFLDLNSMLRKLQSEEHINSPSRDPWSNVPITHFLNSL